MRGWRIYLEKKLGSGNKKPFRVWGTASDLRFSPAVPSLLIMVIIFLIFGARIAAGSIAPEKSPHPVDIPYKLERKDQTFPSPAHRSEVLFDTHAAAANDCYSAITKTLTVTEKTWSGRWDASGATTSPSDPIQSCTWGGESVNSASAWWKLTAPEDGRLTVSTVTLFSDSYDTVVTIYPAEVGCDSLAPEHEVGCSDDAVAFHSIAEALVDSGKSYLIEVTAWGENDPNNFIYLFISFEPATRWHVDYPSIFMSRHILIGHEDYLYAFGGWRPATGQDATYRLNPTTAVWTILEPMPQHYANTDGALVGNNVYIPTGYVENNLTHYEGTHYRYTIDDNSWSTLTPIVSSIQIVYPMTWGAAATDPSESAYYYTGGSFRTAPTNPLDFVLKYHVTADTWEDLPSMDTARYKHRAEFIGDNLCVIGGIGLDDEILAAGECLDSSSQEWVPMASLNIPRHSFGSAVDLDGNWYVFGGSVQNGLTTGKTEVYNPVEGAWTLLDQTWSLRQSRDWPAGARLGNTIYAYGGYLPNDGLNGLVVSTMEWLEMPFSGGEKTYLPMVINGTPAAGLGPIYEPNDSISLAYGPLSNRVALWSDFIQGGDVEDFFYIQTSAAAVIKVVLTNIPVTHDYNLYFYGTDALTGNPKHLFAYSTNPGNSDETIQTEALPPGRYSIRIKNVWNRHGSEQYKLMASW